MKITRWTGLLFIYVLCLSHLIQGVVLENNNMDDDLIREIIGSKKKNIRTARNAVKTHKKMNWKLSPEDAKVIFDTYYKCLERKNAALGKQNEITAILALEGQTVTLKCPVCLRPDQESSKMDVNWQRLRSIDGVLKYLEPGSKIKVKEDMSLVLHSIDVLDAGQYYCVRSHSREYEQIYQVDVLLREKRTLYKESDNPSFLNDTNLDENNLKVFTQWSSWSDCSQCGKMGRRRKVGLCMLDKINQDKRISPEDLPIIDLYPNGIPCRSTVIPTSFKSIKEIGSRHSETLIGNCFEPCPTEQPVITITDNTGSVVEVIPAGYYSLK